MNGKYWEHFPNGAEVGVRGIGASEEDAFEQAALALTALVTDPARVQHMEAVKIKCEPSRDDMLLVDWLNAVIHKMTERRMVFGSFHVFIHDHRLEATAWGEELDATRHRPAAQLKAAIYPGARLHRDATNTWVAQCLVDVEATEANAASASRL
jgi:tRNA nucleotidyltransferase (CCA-adding enzyme)